MIDLLDKREIGDAIRTDARQLLGGIEVFDTLPSTNDYLLAKRASRRRAAICLAEHQTEGRGRDRREWIAPFASGLCLSVGWRFQASQPQLSALSLAAGVAVIRTLRGLGIENVQLKWPNDIVVGDAKLGGILIESRHETAGVHCVLGFGLNVRLPDSARRAIDQSGGRATDLARTCIKDPPSRNLIAARLISEVLMMLDRYEGTGFEPFLSEWQAADASAGRPVTVQIANGLQQGIGCGVDPDGALLVEIGGNTRRFLSGEVRLRLQSTQPATR